MFWKKKKANETKVECELFDEFIFITDDNIRFINGYIAYSVREPKECSSFIGWCDNCGHRIAGFVWFRLGVQRHPVEVVCPYCRCKTKAGREKEL